ncbi:ABC transporter ATP-binding protein [Sulfurovum sp. XGS-02]|uniref:ABC transporter ATP-binding protein n=1 Tax=Sulfurovum sp. XGS-02 TaxID=2925411 RepID=UPI002058EAAF|nr:ABC transporter ATP-binding protein [Sulfurovum sp. XGS-02]UPT78424.1 ABC transporter ATP-binding protein [Sulfurovum sp. XGS-02]
MKLSHVYKTFYPDTPKEVRALTDINLTFEKGEFTTLSGESGSGKTTLLNIIGGLDSATSGEIFFEGEEISAYSEEKMAKLRLHDIGFIFQAYNLIHVLNVRENIGFIMKLLKFDQKEIDARTTELAEILQIADLLDKLPGEISGGQQQRVAVARAVASRPKLILADEPTANLDSKNSARLMNMLRTLNEKEHVTVIFASHDKYVLEQSKRIIVLDDGVVVEDR